MKPSFIKSEHTSKGFSRGTYKVPEISRNDEKVNGRSAWDDDEEIIEQSNSNKIGNLNNFGTKKSPWELSAFGSNLNNNISNKENAINKDINNKTNSENNIDNSKTQTDISTNTSNLNKSVNTKENSISETRNNFNNHITNNKINEPSVT
jgi:hypothetical protein